MAEDFGSGVSRTLSALERGFAQVVWQSPKPILDSELNLIAQIQLDRMQTFVRSQMHSGFISDPTSCFEDFVTDEAWSNWFQLGKAVEGSSAPVLYANINGWVIPVIGTNKSEGDPTNRVDLFPPPSTDTRIDFVFLEAWTAQVAPNPSTANKPAADGVWKYGNVKYGGTAITDDITDPATGYETTERVQVQYRLRVLGSGSGAGSSVALASYPDGLDDPSVVGQGTATLPVSGLSFTNMGDELGDPGLWRAGDGDPDNALGTVDGYTYAIPVCAVFRRNTDPWVALATGGAPNHNGAFDRNPVTVSVTDPSEATLILTTATLTADLDATTTGVVQVDGLVGSGIDDSDHDWNNTFLKIGGEIISISGVNTGASPATITITGRGRYGTAATQHTAATPVQFFNSRPDGLWADQITSTDILDLRKAVNIGDWDYQRLLQHNLTKLLRGDLRTSFKDSGEAQDEGTYIVEVSEMRATGGPSTGVETVDGPDGFRTVFSDAAALQPDVITMLNPGATQGGQRQVANFTDGVEFESAYDLAPGGFFADTEGVAANRTWENNTVLFLSIDNARTSMDGDRNVRFLTPMEYDLLAPSDATLGNVNPVSLRFIEEAWGSPAAGSETAANHPGPMYPTQATNYEYPFIVLGGVLHPDLQLSGGAEVVPEAASILEVALSGLNFDNPGDFFTKEGGEFVNDPSVLNFPLLDSHRTLYDMLTAGGTDLTGSSSEVYLVLWGDDTPSNIKNNGVFRVIGAGATAGYTLQDATASDRLVVQALDPNFTDFVSETGINAEFRSQYSTTEDEDSPTRAAMCVVLTDVEDDSQNGQWVAASSFTAGQGRAGKAVLRTTVQYGPGRGATMRVANELMRFNSVVLNGEESYLRQPQQEGDPTFPAAAGIEDGEVYWDWSHIQTWNRLSSLGMHAPDAPSYGGQVATYSEQDRESELFIDLGSKTVLFRPFQKKRNTLYKHTLESGDFFPEFFDGVLPVDPEGIFIASRDEGYEVPPELMPRFGRQDIPYFRDEGVTKGLDEFLDGINHLFVDAADANDEQGQFEIIGGTNTGGAGLAPFLITAGSGFSTTYGAAPTGYDGIQGRFIEDLSVLSTDVAPGLRGIELPPFYGLARVYGVYEKAEFDAAGGAVFTDRVTPINTGDAPNLLRRDATKQTLFIRQGGGETLTGDANDHTYILPETAIDLTLSGNFDPNNEFADYNFVVVCSVFGFGRGFINQNNYVMQRRTNAGATNTDEVSDVFMVVPAPATAGSRLAASYKRTPYQGDPYMTRGGNNLISNDYEDRYGRIPQGDAVGLENAIQQYDSEGNFIPQTPNSRALQVLASVDFYTTLGTGNIGGPLYPGTVTDIGHIENTAAASTRVPSAGTDSPWAIEPRAFTAGQSQSNEDRARIEVQVAANGNITAGDTFTVGATTFVADTDFAIGANAGETADALVTAIRGSDEPVQVSATYYQPTTGVAGLVLYSDYPGAAGNTIQVSTSRPRSFRLVRNNFLPVLPKVISNTTLGGGADIPVNGGTGQTPVSLTGLTERLPLGILLQDYDFIGEDPVRDSTGQLFTGLGIISANGAVPVPLAEGGIEYSRLIGGPGQYVGMADGQILNYTAYEETLRPAGSQRFRLYRGGGSAWVLSGDRPGGPVDWVSSSFPAALKPVLKGGVLVGKALLVRNYPETAFASNAVVSYGDEIQMVIMTRGILGSGSELEEGIGLNGIISPSGYGEGYAAADRYRLDGKPQMSGTRAGVDPDVELAPFPFDDLSVNSGCVC